MKVLLTGAFGNVGMSALEELLGRGHRVRCLDLKTRSNERTARRYGSRIEVTWGDLRREADVATAVRGQEVVVHLAFVIPKLSATGLNSEDDPERSRAINVGGTQNLIEAMKAQPTPPRILFSSSLHVYGRTQHLPPPRTVADLPAPIEHYAHHKVECEQMIMSSGLTWAIFRLGAALPVRLILDPGMYEVPLNNRIEFVHTRDVGLAIANALETEEVWGRMWLIGGGPRCQILQKDLTWSVLETIGLGRLPEEAFTNVPYPVDWLDTGESERVLHFQRHTLDDYLKDIRTKLGLGRHLIRLFRPVVRGILLSQSAVLRERKAGRSHAALQGKAAVVIGAREESARRLPRSWHEPESR